MAASSAPAAEAESMLAKLALECGFDITASQDEILATSAFLGGDSGLRASPSASNEEEEVFSTPPDATQQQEDDPVTMCTLPFTPTPSKSPAPPADSDSSDDAPPANPRRRPRVCTRKVRGARIRTPTPSPEQQQPQPEHQPQQPEQQQTEPERPVHVDPLIRAVLMIPTRTTTATTGTSSSKEDPVETFLSLARRKGLI